MYLKIEQKNLSDIAQLIFDSPCVASKMNNIGFFAETTRFS